MNAPINSLRHISILICSMIGVTIFGAVKGDMKKLASPFDAAGNLCGFKYEEI